MFIYISLCCSPLRLSFWTPCPPLPLSLMKTARPASFAFFPSTSSFLPWLPSMAAVTSIHWRPRSGMDDCCTSSVPTSGAEDWGRAWISLVKWLHLNANCMSFYLLVGFRNYCSPTFLFEVLKTQ